MLHLRIQEPLDLCERHDLIELPGDLDATHAEDRAIQVDVLAPGEVGMKAGAHLEQRPDATDDANATGRRLRDSRENLEQRALAGAVSPDDAERRTRLHVERDVAQRPDGVHLVVTLATTGRHGLRETRDVRAREGRGDGVAEGIRYGRFPEAIALSESRRADGGVAHRVTPGPRTCVPCGGNSTRRRRARASP